MNDTMIVEKTKKAAKPKKSEELKNKEIENPDQIIKTKEKSNRPKVTEMVDHALKSLYHYKGCSLVAIKKHIALTFECDEKTIKRISPKIRKHILENLKNNTLLILSGTGLSGSFKLSERPKKSKATKKDTNTKIKNEEVKIRDIKNKGPKNKETKTKEVKTKKVSDSEGKKKEKKVAKTKATEKPTKVKKEEKTVKIKSTKKEDVSHKKILKTPRHKKSLGVVAVRKSIHTPKLKMRRSTTKRDDAKVKLRETKRNKKDQAKNE